VAIALAHMREFIEVNIVIFSTSSLIIHLQRNSSHLASLPKLSEFPTHLRIAIVYGKD